MSIRKAEKYRRCDAADCDRVVKMMSLGPVSTDLPCRDFYSYVCSPWATANPMGINVSWLASQGYIDHLEMDMKKRDPNATTQTVVDMVLITYHSCLQSVKRDLASEMKAVFDKFHIGNWPKFTYSDAESYDVFKELIDLDMKWGMQVVFFFENALLDEYTGGHRLSIQPSPFVCPYVPGSNKSLEGLYEEYVREVFKLFSYQDNAAAQEVVGTHVALCQASIASGHDYKVHTLQEIVAGTRALGLSESQWNTALEPMGTINRKTVYHTKLQYIKEALRHLLKTMHPESAMRFFGFSILTQMAGHQEVFQKVRDAYYYFDHPLARSSVQAHNCMAFIFTHFMNAWNLYVLSVENANKNSAKDVGHLVASIKNSMIRRVRNSRWMDELSKSRTLEKLKRTTVVPPVLGSYLKTFNLSERYANLPALSPADYYGNQLLIRANDAQYHVRGTKRHLGEANFAMAGGDINHLTNTVHVYAGLLRLPFYSAEFPLAIRYGGLGTVTARLLAELLIGNNVKKDAVGSTKNWWTGPVYQEYKRRVTCFAQQAKRDAAFGEEVDFLPYYLGARIALDALHYAMVDRKSRILLPGIELSDQQLFFTSFCHMMCASVEVEGKPMLPEKALRRCNGAVMNMREFGRAFRCNRTDVDQEANLNPAHKCLLY
ncbi:hypothetical protein V5799_017753 [Amblyomma americanum]|uniref:M13 family peptidase n=1 Tax=Amblyomma americanum TaxID=6943 RepID=A0AAQ4F1D5_AMBAM